MSCRCPPLGVLTHGSPYLTLPYLYGSPYRTLPLIHRAGIPRPQWRALLLFEEAERAAAKVAMVAAAAAAGGEEGAAAPMRTKPGTKRGVKVAPADGKDSTEFG